MKWDPSSSGGIASYFQLDDNHVVSLIGHVSIKWMNNWFRDQQRKIIILKLRSIQLQHVRVKIMRYSIHQNKELCILFLLFVFKTNNKTTIIQINEKQHSLTKWGTNHNKSSQKHTKKTQWLKKKFLPNRKSKNSSATAWTGYSLTNFFFFPFFVLTTKWSNRTYTIFPGK